MRGEVNNWIKVKKPKYYHNGYGKSDCISKKSESLKFRRLKSRGFKVSPRDHIPFPPPLKAVNIYTFQRTESVDTWISRFLCTVHCTFLPQPEGKRPCSSLVYKELKEVLTLKISSQ